MSAARSYQVLATKCEGWWAVEIPGDRRCDDHRAQPGRHRGAARDLLAGLFGIARHSFDLELAFSATLLPHPREPRTPADADLTPCGARRGGSGGERQGRSDASWVPTRARTDSTRSQVDASSEARAAGNRPSCSLRMCSRSTSRALDEPCGPRGVGRGAVGGLARARPRPTGARPAGRRRGRGSRRRAPGTGRPPRRPCAGRAARRARAPARPPPPPSPARAAARAVAINATAASCSRVSSSIESTDWQPQYSHTSRALRSGTARRTAVAVNRTSAAATTASSTSPSQ